MFFERFIYSLGIRHIGLENAKLISKNLKTSSNFHNLSKNKNFKELLNIDGIGETQINSIKNFFSNKTNLDIINKLVKVLKIEDAFAIYIPALTPLPDTSAKVKKYSSGVDLTTSK